MNKVKKLAIRISECRKDTKEFGLTISLTSFLWPLFQFFPFCFSNWIMKKKHKKVLEYISVKYNDIIKHFHFESETQPDFNGAIWFCWLQGEANMPSTVQFCLKTLKKHANNHPVIVIDLINYDTYVTIPRYIIQKYERGEIKNAHFADIIRTCLLYEHGGLWIDSTLLVTNPFPEELFKRPFYSCKSNNKSLFITQCKWSNFFLYAPKHSAIFAFTREIFFAYIKREKRFIDYFLMDYIMYLGYITYPKMKKIIDAVPINNKNVHNLSPILNHKLDINIWTQLTKNTYLFKLNWKTIYVEKTGDNLSYWGYIKQKING